MVYSLRYISILFFCAVSLMAQTRVRIDALPRVTTLPSGDMLFIVDYEDAGSTNTRAIEYEDIVDLALDGAQSSTIYYDGTQLYVGDGSIVAVKIGTAAVTGQKLHGDVAGAGLTWNAMHNLELEVDPAGFYFRGDTLKSYSTVLPAADSTRLYKDIILGGADSTWNVWHWSSFIDTLEYALNYFDQNVQFNQNVLVDQFVKSTWGYQVYDTTGTSQTLMQIDYVTNHIFLGNSGLSTEFKADTLDFDVSVFTGLDYSDLENIPITFTPENHTHTESEITDLDHFTNSDETDQVFTAWDKSTGISITESQISDLDHFTNADETDQVFTAWDKSTGISITESQISDLDHFTNTDETDQVFMAWDKSTGISITESQISDFGDYLTSADLSNYMLKAAFDDSFNVNVSSNDQNWKTTGRISGDYFAVLDSAGSPLTMINYIESATDYTVVGNSGRRLVLKGGNSTDAIDIDDGITNINQLTLDTALNPNYFSAYADLVVESKIGTGSAQVAAGNHTHTESQITDLDHFTNADETDQVFTAWDKSTGISITESQISDLDHFTNADETDQVFTAWDKSTGISITESQISDLDHFTNADETDQVFVASAASGITSTNISNWNSAYSHSTTISGNPHNLDATDIGLTPGQIVDWTDSGNSTTFYSGNANVTGSFNLTGSAYITSNSYMSVNDKGWFFKNTSGANYRGFILNASDDFVIGQASGVDNMYFAHAGGYAMRFDASKDATLYGNVTINKDLTADEIDATWIGDNFDMDQINLTLPAMFRLSGNTLIFDYEPSDFSVDGEGYFGIKALSITYEDIANSTIDTTKINDTQFYQYIEDHSALADLERWHTEWIDLERWESLLISEPDKVSFNSIDAVRVYEFDGTVLSGSEEELQYTFSMPTNYKAGTDFYLYVSYYPGGTTTDDVQWQFDYRTGNVGSSYSTSTSKTVVVTAGMTNLIRYVSGTSACSGTGLTATSNVYIIFSRQPNSPNDSYSGSMYVDKIGIRYQTTGFGDVSA